MERDSTKGSQTPHLSQAALSPQLLSPPLFVPWSQVANLRGIVSVHKDYEACPYDELRAAIDHPTGLVPGEKDLFLAANDNLLSQLEDLVMPLESIATQVFQAIYQRQQAEISWIALLWAVAKLNKYWIGYDALFLHEWRRCVCRLCTSHLSRVNRELPARLRSNRERENTNQPPNNKPNKHQQTTGKGATCKVTRSAKKA